MNYKKELIKMIRKLKSEAFLRQIYIIVKRHFEKGGD